MPKEKEAQKEEKPSKEAKFVIAEMATRTKPVIRDNKTETIYDEMTMLCKLANDIEEIKDHLIG